MSDVVAKNESALDRVSRLAKLSTDEFERRLRDPELVKDIPNHVLIQGAIGFSRLAVHGEQGDMKPPKQLNILNIIQSGGLPPERQKQLLVQAVEQIESAGRDPGDVIAALVDLVGEDEANKLLAIEGEAT